MADTLNFLMIHHYNFQYKVRPIPGTAGIEEKAAGFTHYLLYGFMTIMPASGIAMGYFGE